MSIFADMKVAVRSLVKSAGFSLIAIGMLAMGIGGTVFMFATVKGYMLSPAPYPNSQELIYVERTITASGHNLSVTGHEYLDYIERQSSFKTLAGYQESTVIIGGDEYPERHEGGAVTANLFDTLQVKPLLGRTFTAEDDVKGAPPVVLLGYNLWQQRFAGEQNIIGRQLRVNGENATIIGVMPQGFKFPVNQDLWVPMQLDITGQPRGSSVWLKVTGRLKEGISVAAAQAEFANIAAALTQEFPDNNSGIGIRLSPLAERYVSDNTRSMLFIMFVAGFFVLLIACANVANLVLTRTVVRQKELAIRTALGASRGGIISLVLAETFVISALSTVIGVWVAHIGVGSFESILISLGATIPFWIDMSVDWQVVAFASLVTFLATLLAGLAPAWRASQTNVHETMKDGTRGSSASIGPISKSLVIGEIALSCALLIGAGLLVRSVHNLTNLDLGIDTENILTGRILLPHKNYPDNASRAQFYQRLEQEVKNLPGVVNATVTGSLPGMFTSHEWYTAEGSELVEGEGQPWAQYIPISPSYFSTLGRQMEEGRDIAITDEADSPKVVVINRMFANEVWPGQPVIGKKIRLGEPSENREWLTIVGVAPNIHQDEVDDPIGAAIYLPITQASRIRALTLAVRTAGDPLQLSNSVRDAVVAIDRDLAVYWVRSLKEWIQVGMISNRVISTMFSIFAGMAILLAVTGIYAVLSYLANQRTREFGVRRALGASGGNIFTIVLRQGFVQLGIGLIFGFALAYGFSQYLASRLFGVATFDVATYLLVGLVLFVMVILAGLVPAMRALRVQPMEALRYE
ncbi:MAG: ABC transporter permease [Gammaproteobacteria bacterium]|nr:ABC transporter permease [Gammaproteobacteria bacterium]